MDKLNLSNYEPEDNIPIYDKQVDACIEIAKSWTDLEIVVAKRRWGEEVINNYDGVNRSSRSIEAIAKYIGKGRTATGNIVQRVEGRVIEHCVKPFIIKPSNDRELVKELRRNML